MRVRHAPKKSPIPRWRSPWYGRSPSMPGHLQVDPLLNPDYHDILREFNAVGVDYLAAKSFAD